MKLKMKPLVSNEESSGFLYSQKQVELDKFGQRQIMILSRFLYNIGDQGGYGKTCGFLRFPPWEKMKHHFVRGFATSLHDVSSSLWD